MLVNYKVHAGSFHVSIIHQTLTWTTGCLTCVRDHSYAWAYTQGLGTPTASQRNIFDSEKHIFFLCSLRGSNLGSLVLESDAVPTEPPCHPTDVDEKLNINGKRKESKHNEHRLKMVNVKTKTITGMKKNSTLEPYEEECLKVVAMTFKPGMTVDLWMAYILMLVLMTLTLMQGHSGSAEEKNQC